MSLEDVVKIDISRSAAAVSRAGFGIMLILGPNAPVSWGSEKYRSYTKASDMLTDGFTTSNAEYKAALAAFSQNLKPTKILVGKRATAVAQVTTVDLNGAAQNNAVYTVTIDGVPYTLTSDGTATEAEIHGGLLTLINADAACKATASGGTTDLVLTAKQAGIGFSVALTANLQQTATTANVGVQTDLTAIRNLNNDWYALVLTSRDNAEILEAAAWIEAERKIFVPSTSDSAVIATGSSDIASKLKNRAYARTAYLYSGDQASMPEAAWLGGQLPEQPGSNTYKFKELKGIAVDNLTSTQFTEAKAKRANVYTSVGGGGMAEEGVTASAEYIDVIIGIDWVHANMQADVFQALKDNKKIPFTDNGIAVIERCVRNRLKLAVDAGILADFTVTVPKVADVSSGDKAARKLPGVSFTGTLAGAIHSTTITGNVTV